MAREILTKELSNKYYDSRISSKEKIWYLIPCHVYTKMLPCYLHEWIVSTHAKAVVVTKIHAPISINQIL
jgi:hypothetical protein